MKKSVGIKELKSNLSQYLKLIKSGEVIVIKSHNKIIAEIRQPLESDPEHSDNKQKLEAYLDKLKSENKLRRANRTLSLIETLKPTKKIPAEKWKKIYQEVREDR